LKKDKSAMVEIERGFGRMAAKNAWLVRTIDGRFRVKWRDEDTVLQDQDFDTEAEARSFGGEGLEFRPDMETALLQARRLREQDASLSPEEGLRLVGIVTERFEPGGES
jgi:hypothetical protein